MGYSKLKIFGITVGGLIALLLLMVVLGLFGLGWFKFFGPKYEDVRRDIFENTQSYVHGKIQALAKYKNEHDRAESPAGKEAIRQLIINQFAEFDETKIKAAGLRNFLTNMRGY
ncbi:hypothetical protein LCGC14_2617760 [marine sediment metagenome]|uniref:Uncharacterized protein n=1 Tax=marine sediment metagenome TaxID=412755 RepID=A0A0F9CF33_9ZZZZ